MQNEHENLSKKNLVNLVAVQNCQVSYATLQCKLLDISLIRIVIEAPAVEIGADLPIDGAPAVDFPEINVPFELKFSLDRYRFAATVSVQSRGEGWIRLGYEKLAPSAGAHLKSFLSPKKVGESLLEDWRTDFVRHYHGLNESELSFEPNGGILFSYSDLSDVESQFVIRIKEIGGPLRAGRISRRDYIHLNSIDNELPLIGLTDREIFVKLGECRDIVTNFRPNGQIEYNVKQRLLKIISDYLYSTSPKVEFSQVRPTRTVTHMLNET
jgi:hypothetical protein